VVIHLDGPNAQVGLPVLVISDKQSDGRIDELRIYYSSWPLRGRHAIRPPVLQSDPKLRAPDVVAEYLSALSAGDADAIVATFEPDGYAREPAGAPFVHRGHDDLRAFYEWLFSNGGGIAQERCLVTDDRARDWPAVRDGERRRMAVYSQFREAAGGHGGIPGITEEARIPQTWVVGTVEECVTELAAFIREYGLTDLVTWGVPPGMRPDQMNHSLERFARDVAPRLRAMFPGS